MYAPSSFDGVHCRETYVVPVSVTDSTGAVGGCRSRAGESDDAESDDAESSAATTTKAAPPDAEARSRAKGFITFLPAGPDVRWCRPTPPSYPAAAALPTRGGGFAWFESRLQTPRGAAHPT